MQIVFKNEVERSNGRITGTVGLVVCAGRIGRCMEGECSRGGGI